MFIFYLHIFLLRNNLSRLKYYIYKGATKLANAIVKMSLWRTDNSYVKLINYVLVSTECVWIKNYYDSLCQRITILTHATDLNRVKPLWLGHLFWSSILWIFKELHVCGCCNVYHIITWMSTPCQIASTV